jgi:hypothetical protein
MGQFAIGPNYVVPGLRENLYAKITVNLGIFLTHVNKAEEGAPPRDFVSASSCTIWARLGQVVNGRDRWFDVGEDNSKLAVKLIKLFEKFGLPFLDQFPDYPSILAHHEKCKKYPNVPAARSILIAAIVAHHLGKTKKAKELFKKAYATSKGGWEHAAEVAENLGVKING